MANNEHNRSVRDSQRLLASYPISSAVPSGHVARHLDNLTIAAPPPSFVNQQYYDPPPYSNQSSYHPEYSRELQYLRSNQSQAGSGSADGGYWERTRDQATNLIAEQAGSSYPYPPPPLQWPTPSNSHLSSFQTPAMANAIFASAYPTPPELPPIRSIQAPPPSTYTSSLAGALGPVVSLPRQTQQTSHQSPPRHVPQQQPPRHAPPPHSQPPPPPNHTPSHLRHAPADSASFFNNVLAQKSQQIRQQKPVNEGLRVSESRTLFNFENTPRSESLSPTKKRKMIVEVEVPSPSKRLNMGHGSFSDRSLPSTPSKLGRKSASAPSIFPKTPSTTHSTASSVPRTPTTPGLATPQSGRSMSAVTSTGTGLKRKTFTLDCVETTPSLQKPFITPTTGGRTKKARHLLADGDSDTELDDDEDELNLASSPLKPLLYDSATKSRQKAGRDPLTHDRDERAPLEKLRILLEEIFEAEDGLPNDPTSADLSTVKGGAILNPDSEDPSKPQLSAAAIRKLTKYIGQVRGSRGLGKSAHASPVKGRSGRGGRIGDLSSDVLGRTLRMLARSVKLGEAVDPFGALTGSSSVKDELTRSPTKTPKKKKSRTPVGKDEEDEEKDEVLEVEGHLTAVNAADNTSATREPSKEPKTPKKDKGKGKASSSSSSTAVPSAADLDILAHKLTLSRDGVLAAECIIALLGGESGKSGKSGERLSRQLYSEEIILGCLSVVKGALEGGIYPFVEGCSGIGTPLLLYLVNTSPSASGSVGKGQQSPTKSGGGGTSTAPSSSSGQSLPAKTEACRHLLAEVFAALSATLPRLSALVSGSGGSAGSESGMPMSDSVVVKAVYIGIGPFFVTSDEGSSHAVKEEGWEGDGKAKGKGRKKSQGSGGMLMRTFGKSAMRGLRMDALGLIRSIFAHHDEQRSWIIEEILSSLIKVSHAKQGKAADQFRLRDGRSMRTVSALLLQLVQTSAHDVRLGARKIDRARQSKVALRRQESILLESQQSQANVGGNEGFLDDEDRAAIRLHSSALSSPHKAASTIIQFLTSRSGKTKTTKNSNEAEYRAIFDALVQDCLGVWCWPEWPSAGVVLSVVVRGMVRSLEEKHSDKEKEGAGDNSAAKSMALDHLGVIAAKVRTLVLKVQGVKEEDGTQSSATRGDGGSLATKAKWRGLRSLDQIVDGLDIKELERYLSAHWDVAAHLGKRAAEDQAYDSAQELSAAALGQDLAGALQKVDRLIEDDSAEDDGRRIVKGRHHEDEDEDDELNLKSRKDKRADRRRDSNKLKVFGETLKLALRDVWNERNNDVFDIGSQEEVVRVDRQAEEIGAVQMTSLKNGFNPMLNVTLQALDAPAIFMRTKALRALGLIITSDPAILALPNVRGGIERHLLDPSSAVRDAAVELIGKYMIDSPDVAADYYSKIADRIADTGLSVRKRVIKLLKAYYVVTDDVQRQIDIATKLVLRMMDEDDTVKDLAIKIIEDLWFPFASTLPSALKSSKGNSSTGDSSNSSLQNKVAVIMGVSSNFRDRQSPLEDLLHKIMAAKEAGSPEAQALHGRYEEICGVLIDGLVDASDLPGYTLVNCIRTINLITSAYPSVIGTQYASTLLPYLKNPSNPEEQATTDYLLKIFRAAIPLMPKTAAKFGQELQPKLQLMILKPSATGGIPTLQEAVACLCIVVQHLTHEFSKLVALLKSCNGRLQQAIKQSGDEALSANNFRTFTTLIFITSLLAEHCNFDKLRDEQPLTQADLDAVSKGNITEHIYTSLLALHQRYSDPSFRARILPCLGFLFRAQPTLMTLEQSATIMDGIFASEDEDGKARLLKIIQDFLISESMKHSAKEKESAKLRGAKAAEVNMDELVGNTDGFADSGVSSAVVQRYLDFILDAALSTHPHIQASAIDILTFTIKQGLAHPLQSFPIIIALETSPSPSLSNRASALHAILHNKHTSLLNSRFALSARKSFDYQRKVSSDGVKGYRMQPMPVAVLQRWYSLVREKRAQRQDFLKAVLKVFQDRPDYQSSQDDVDFTRYMAENFSALDYKTQEEVFTVIKFLTTVLSTAGSHVLEVLSPSNLLTNLHTPLVVDTGSAPTLAPAQETTTDVPMEVEGDLQEKLPFMRTSIIIAMVMLLKAHLKTLYGLSEEKCSKFSLTKKSAIGDKPATKKHDKPISWSRLPFATKPILTSADVKEQKERFIDIWNEDGVVAEPEDDFA